jgi:hypothetical protein
MYIDYCGYLDKVSFTRDKLKEFVSEYPTIEHVLAQNPTFSLKSAGFENETDFTNTEHRLGNLAILERRLNSGARNRSPIDKTSVYDRSKFRMSRDLSSQIASAQKFDKNAIEDRTEEIWKYLALRWWC